MLKSKYLIIGTASLLLVGVIWYFSIVDIKKNTLKDSVAHEVLIQAAKELHLKYITGLYDTNLNCFPETNSYKVGSDFSMCNELFLDCFLQNSIEIKAKSGKSYVVHARSSNQKSIFLKRKRKIETFGHKVRLSLELSNNILSVDFLNNCNEVLLPPKKYKTNSERIKKNYYWDNLNRKIFIDKYQAKYKDFYLLSEVKKRDYQGPNDLSFKIVNFNKMKMIELCRFKKKSLLTSHIFEAATFYRSFADTSKEIVNSPYPWGFRQKRIDHKKVFSWIGITDFWKGKMEYIRNPWDREFNIKASSEYFTNESFWHELGLKASWNELDLKPHSFKWIFTFNEEEKNIEPIKAHEMDLAFRCYREGS